MFGPIVDFLLSLTLTLTLLVGVVATGMAARRRVHIPLVGLTVLSLAATIYCAERLGEHYDMESAGFIFPFHINLALVTVAAYLLPVISGLMTIRNKKNLTLHGRIAWVVLSLTVATAVTGAVMVAMADPLPVAEP